MHSKASFVLGQSNVTPGSRVNLGIQFVTDNDWHIYWKNPGDSGEPPRIQWQLPQGITAGALEWPTPIRMNTTAGTDYGYTGTTVLLSSLQIPATAQSGTVEISGSLRWLVCHDVCIPQSTELKVPLRIADSTKVDDSGQSLLMLAEGKLPKPIPEGFRPVARSSPDSFQLTLFTAQPVAKAEFYPSEVEQIDNAAPQELASRAGVTKLTFRKSQYLRQEPQQLRGVIVLNGQDAYQIDAPIHNSSPTQERSHPK